MAIGTVPFGLIVINLNILQDGLVHGISGDVAFAVEQPDFHGVEKTLGYRLIITVPPAAPPSSKPRPSAVEEKRFYRPGVKRKGAPPFPKKFRLGRDEEQCAIGEVSPIIQACKNQAVFVPSYRNKKPIYGIAQPTH